MQDLQSLMELAEKLSQDLQRQQEILREVNKSVSFSVHITLFIHMHPNITNLIVIALRREITMKDDLLIFIPAAVFFIAVNFFL